MTDHFDRSAIRRIVVATDFSPGATAAVDRALQLAQAHGAALHLLHAFDVSVWHSLQSIVDVHRLTTDPPHDVRTQQRLTEQAAALAARSGVVVEAHFGVGAPEEVIDGYVKAHEASLMVIGSRADPDVIGVGGTVAKLVRSPACPVLIVRQREAAPYDKVMSAVDLREVSMRAAGFAVALLPTAHHHLAFAVDPALDRALWLGELPQEGARQLHDSVRVRAHDALQQLGQVLAAQARHPVVCEIVDDVPARGLVVRAWSLPANCVVVGHHGQGQLEQSLLGSIAKQLKQHTTCDVLIVP